MPITSDIALDEYTALREGAALQSRAGVLTLGDADRVDFLQRMTTNDIAALQPGQSCVTVLTSPTARITHTFTVVARAADLLLLPASGEGVSLECQLRGQIFFMDRVTVTNLDATARRVRLMGPHAATVLATLGPHLKAGTDGIWQEEGDILAVAQAAYDVPGYELIVPVAGQERVMASLTAAGAVLLAGSAAYTARRIELGRPAPGAELTGEYNPLEVGLSWVCAENKGCYTGQEIIARQISYEKVTRMLVGLRCAAPIATAASIMASGRTVGTVTSSAFSPSLGGPVALAVVKRQFTVPGTLVTVDGHSAEVSDLPFRVMEP